VAYVISNSVEIKYTFIFKCLSCKWL